MIAEAMLPPPVEEFGEKKRDGHVSFGGGVFIVMVSMVVLVLVGVWYGSEEHHVCYVPIKAIFCECNNSIVEAIVLNFPLCGCVCG